MCQSQFAIINSISCSEESFTYLCLSLCQISLKVDWRNPRIIKKCKSNKLCYDLPANWYCHSLPCLALLQKNACLISMPCTKYLWKAPSVVWQNFFGICRYKKHTVVKGYRSIRFTRLKSCFPNFPLTKNPQNRVSTLSKVNTSILQKPIFSLS